MMSIQGVKQRILLELEWLSLPQLMEILQLIVRFKFKSPPAKTPLNPLNDPILQTIGLADVPPHADEIDEILYGELA